MRVVSVNVGMPREVPWRGGTVLTGIFKDPVAAPVPLRRLNLDGDAQADRSVHGGPDKAVYAYPSEHYAGWQGQLGRDLPPGAFGENLTTEGLLEGTVHVGDEFRVGTARLVATQPRMPCFKLGIRFDDPTMVRRFLQSGWSGIYFAVVAEGVVGPGDPIVRLRSHEERLSITALLGLILDPDPSPDALRRALRIPALAAVWREQFEERLGSTRT
jgi:MOSC domain-containing protein YiiM